MTKVRHVLGISGGKDSAALALYLNDKHPELDIEYYTCDTGKELDETYELVEKLEQRLGKKIVKLQANKDTLHSPFDYLLKIKGNYLPSHFSRWCTRELKLKPFEDWIKDDPVVSYVGIRGDEDREGYISKKSNIQSIFPFRRNIWSEDVISKVLVNASIAQITQLYEQICPTENFRAIRPYLEQPISFEFSQKSKLEALLDA
ncbi:MAG: phosphoadenosine phosphosulfate reductase family protein, partial [Chitinophagales bacterium]